VQSEPGAKKAVARFATLDVVDCVSCGQPVHHSKLSKHLESCYFKVENTHAVVAKELTYDEDGTNIVCCDVYDLRTKTYCKKLKASCPLHSEHFVRSIFFPRHVPRGLTFLFLIKGFIETKEKWSTRA
jgi:hypothetical protein